MLSVGYFTSEDGAVMGTGWEGPETPVHIVPHNPSDSVRAMFFYLGADAEIEFDDAMDMILTRPPEVPIRFWC